MPAVRSALRETVFRFELVMRINVVTHELVDREEAAGDAVRLADRPAAIRA